MHADPERCGDGRTTPRLAFGWCSLQGERSRNEDFVALRAGDVARLRDHGFIAAIADGVGGHKGGRVAAELAVRGFIDAHDGQNPIGGIRRSAGLALDSMNRWIHAMGRVDPALAGMATTFTAMILQGRTAHVVHAGDSRLYRLRDGRLTRLTTDHVSDRPGLRHVLTRGLGLAAELPIAYATEPVQPHDRFLLCTDGLHGVMADAAIGTLLAEGSPTGAATRLAEAALAARSQDNVSVAVVDVEAVPPVQDGELAVALSGLTLLPDPQVGQEIDGFVLERLLARGRQTQVFVARDLGAVTAPDMRGADASDAHRGAMPAVRGDAAPAARSDVVPAAPGGDGSAVRGGGTPALPTDDAPAMRGGSSVRLDAGNGRGARDGSAEDARVATTPDIRRDTARSGLGQVVLKFPAGLGGAAGGGDAQARQMVLREEWIGLRVVSPWLAASIALPAERRHALYAVQAYYPGETLEQRLRRRPRLSLAAGLQIGIRLGKAVAALHRAGVIHRDIKPENVQLQEGGGLRLLDLGVARVAALADDGATAGMPGTASFMAPEMLDGSNAGDARTDLFALGVTLYRAWSGAYPYGEVEPFQRKQFGRPVPLATHRPDLPPWLDAVLARAIAVRPEERYDDVIELIFALEHGVEMPGLPPRGRVPLLARDPVRFWQAVSLLLALALLGLALSAAEW